MPDLQPYIGPLLAALAICAVLIIAILIYKLINQRVRGRRGSRLGINEYHELDKTRRLVLVRRDGMEHLLLIGGPQDVVIETGIDSGAMAELSHVEPVNEPIPIRQAPRPAIFGSRRPPLRPVEPSMRNNGDDDQAS